MSPSGTPARETRPVFVGGLQIGGGAPVRVQTMTKVPIEDVEGTLAQIADVADAGCDLVRCAVPNVTAAKPFGEVVKRSPLPVVADIHLDARIALAALEAGAHKLRINPGNMGDWEAIRRVLGEARERSVPIRIGVNAGSLRPEGDAVRDPVARETALVNTALAYAERFEAMKFFDIVLSLKTSDVVSTIRVNRLAAARCAYPLHIGVTEAGPEEDAVVRSAAGVGALLADGIGETIRLSFTAPPRREVEEGLRLLRALGLRRDAPRLVSCPTCGRCRTDLMPLVREVKEALVGMDAPLTVAVMGCEVNGPGEAADADAGIACAGGRFLLFSEGEKRGVYARGEALGALLVEVRRLATSRPE